MLVWYIPEVQGQSRTGKPYKLLVGCMYEPNHYTVIYLQEQVGMLSGVHVLHYTFPK
jgi:hypothetical protein